MLCCRTCGHVYIDENPPWAVKWPGHYIQCSKICSSRPCSRRRLELKELHVLRTPGKNPRTLENEGFDPDYAFRIRLRTRDECSGLEQVAESCCILCKERTIFSGNRTRFTDHSPRYTIGRTPLYVERRPDFLQYKSLARIVPVQEIASISLGLILDFSKRIVYLDREVKSRLMDSVQRPSARTPQRNRERLRATSQSLTPDKRGSAIVRQQSGISEVAISGDRSTEVFSRSRISGETILSPPQIIQAQLQPRIKIRGLGCTTWYLCARAQKAWVRVPPGLPNSPRRRRECCVPNTRVCTGFA